MLKVQIQIFAAGVLLLVAVVACSTGPKVAEFPATANSDNEIQSLAADLKTAAEQQVNVLSPSAYEQAEKALKSALTYQQKGKDKKEILHAVAIGRAQLNRANHFAQLSHNNMEEVVAARQAAIMSDAPRLFSKDFNTADNHLRDLTLEIEENDLSGVANNRAKLQKEYLEVELKAIKQANLGPVQATISLAVKEGAKDYAKQSLAIAEKKLNDTEAFIVANRHQTDAVKSRTSDAMNSANHLVKITRASKAGRNISTEDTALLLESEQNKTQYQRDQLNEEKQRTERLAAETDNLKSDQAFNRSFEDARAAFESNEAEVYRQGNRLVIRLRSLEFPVNQSVLRGSNFPLLAKVAKVVKEFEDPSVAVEGFTDSDGGKALNQRLSTERAQAVAEYLVSSEVVDRENITAVGYGFERPLASNKTAKGRAQNRRVDVIISPEMMAE